MTFRPNYRGRVYTSWAQAADHARGWGNQTGWKYRVSRYRGHWWIVRPTRKRAIVRTIGIRISFVPTESTT